MSKAIENISSDLRCLFELVATEDPQGHYSAAQESLINDIGKLYNAFHGTNHMTEYRNFETLPGFFRPYEMQLEMPLNATLTPIALIVGGVLLAFSAVIMGLSASVRALYALVSGKKEKNRSEKLPDKECEESNFSIETVKILGLLAPIVAAIFIPLVAIGFSISLVTRTISTLHNLLFHVNMNNTPLEDTNLLESDSEDEYEIDINPFGN